MSRWPFVIAVLIIPILSIISEVVSPGDADLETSFKVSRVEQSSAIGVAVHEDIEKGRIIN